MRNLVFDSFFVFIIPMIGVSLAFTALYFPAYLEMILAIDILVFSNHHVIATYMRLFFYNERSELLFLTVWLPLMITTTVAVLVNFGYLSWLFTIFIHWQWYHYCKQSNGIHKTFSFKLRSFEDGNETFNRFVFYMTPVVTFLIMCSRDTRLFLGRKVYLLPVSAELMNIVGLAALLLFGIWFFIQTRALLNKKMNFIHYSYLLSHHVIYFIGYVLIKKLTLGWIALSVWHNLQYISYVWHFNTSHAQHNPVGRNKFLELLSRPKFLPVYLIVGVVSTYAFYKSVGFITKSGQGWINLPLFFIANQIIIYHHYAVDAYIWKLRKKEIKSSLGIAEVI